MALIDNLIKQGWLKTARIVEAFRKIKRIDFLPEDSKNLAELNQALPIGYGQTISQPMVVAFMLEQLQPQKGDKILDIGSGSGWTTALLSEIVGEDGRVFAIEFVKELKDFGERNTVKYNFVKKGIAKFVCADGSKGYEKEAPFDRILASASAKKIPLAWKKQLKIGGKIVTPIKTSIWVFTKNSETDFEEVEHSGFVFVPLVTDDE
ncbi:MAG: protein-L-isoaspartate O-methyltransferase [Patescibacteria group bacterium]|nr:protein-L-isoaspartate O-methyltransferase [Patescibacteria group bacterium]